MFTVITKYDEHVRPYSQNGSESRVQNHVYMFRGKGFSGRPNTVKHWHPSFMTKHIAL